MSMLFKIADVTKRRNRNSVVTYQRDSVTYQRFKSKR